MTWTRQPLKHLARVSVSNVDKKSAEGEFPVHLVNYTDVYYGDRLNGSMALMEATATDGQIRAFHLRAGDVVITKDSETAEDIGMAAFVESSGEDMVLGYHLAMLRPRAQVIDGRFLYWAMCSDEVRSQLAIGATGVTRFGLRADVISSVELRVPKIALQQAIADFLDSETARIDALITKKRRMIDLLQLKLGSERSRVLWSGQPSTLPLKHLTPVDRQIMYGIVLPGPDVAEGVPIVKGGDVAAGFQRPLCKTTLEIERAHVRSRLRTYDLAFSIRGGIGDVVIVTDDVAGANITQDVARVSPAESVEPRWLLHALKSPEIQAQAAQRTTGATIRGLNIWDLKLVCVPALTRETQRMQADELDLVQSKIERAAARLTKQMNLLQEHRQALITAAVTGELNLPGVTG